MNITFLIGNGFDIRLGLKTKFSDFYDIYVDLNKSNSNQIIKDFCRNLEDDKAKFRYANWSDFECAFPKYVKKEIELTTILSDFTQKFYMYLREIELNDSILSEDMVIKKFHDFIFKGYKNAVLDSDRNNVEKFFKDPNNNVNFVNFNYTNTLCLLSAFLMARIQKDEGSFDRFLFRELRIHGTLSDNIIIGIDDVDDLCDECSCIPYIGYYCVKHDMNNILGNNRELLYKTIISESDVIVAYGLSFGFSDRSRWIELKNWLCANSPDHTLILYQHDSEFTDKKLGSLKAYIPDYLKKINDIKAQFLINNLRVSEAIAHEPKMLKRIVLVDSDKVLGFKLNEEKEEQVT